MRRVFICLASIGLALLSTAGTWVMGPGKGAFASVAPAIIQSDTDAHYNVNAVATVTGTTSGNKLVAIGFAAASGITLSISGGGLTWTEVFAYNAATYSWKIWTATSAGGSVTATQTISPGQYNFLNLLEVRGIGALDGTPAHADPSGTTNLATGSVSSDAGDLVIVCVWTPNVQLTYSDFTDGFTIYQQENGATESGGFYSNATAYELDGSGGSTSTTFDLSSSAEGANVIMIFDPL